MVRHVTLGKFLRCTSRLFPTKWKEWNETDFWLKWKASQLFNNGHYQEFFTGPFGLQLDFYSGKRIIDLGCGPMGSLEWADIAAERIGLDPLAKKYRQLGTDLHKMKYVAAPSEAIPFDAAYFDVVTSFNSLDHVADLQRTIEEIDRVLKPGGLFLLLTELDHEPTNCEPQVFSWDVVKRFEPRFELLLEQHYERGDGIYSGVMAGTAYDHSNLARRGGILVAKLQKQPGNSNRLAEQ